MNTESHDDPQRIVQQFKWVKRGLDPDQVFDFIARLIQKNAEYAEKLEIVDSLKRLADITLIEAHKMAEQIKAEAALEAAQNAMVIAAELETEAKLQPQQIVAEAEKLGQAKIAAAEDLAKRIMDQAAADAERIRAEAGDEANKIVTNAYSEAEQLLNIMRALAEAEAGSIMIKAREDAEGTKGNAEKEALIMTQKARDILSRAMFTISQIENGLEDSFAPWGTGERAEVDEVIN